MNIKMSVSQDIAAITVGFVVACAGLLPFFFAAGKLMAGG